MRYVNQIATIFLQLYAFNNVIALYFVILCFLIRSDSFFFFKASWFLPCETKKMQIHQKNSFNIIFSTIKKEQEEIILIQKAKQNKTEDYTVFSD